MSPHLPADLALYVSRLKKEKFNDTMDKILMEELKKIQRDPNIDPSEKQWVREILAERKEDYIVQCQHMIVFVLQCKKFADNACTKSLDCPLKKDNEISCDQEITVMGHLTSNADLPNTTSIGGAKKVNWKDK